MLQSLLLGGLNGQNGLQMLSTRVMFDLDVCKLDMAVVQAPGRIETRRPVVMLLNNGEIDEQTRQ